MSLISGSDIVIFRLDISFSKRSVCFTGKFMAYLQSSVAVLRERKMSLYLHINCICFFRGINRVIQREFIIMCGNVSYVKLRLCNKENLYRKLNCYSDNSERL
jgi:hypothetical protein